MTQWPVSKGAEGKNSRRGQRGLVCLRDAAWWHYGNFTVRALGHHSKGQIYFLGAVPKMVGTVGETTLFRLMSTSAFQMYLRSLVSRAFHNLTILDTTF